MGAAIACVVVVFSVADVANAAPVRIRFNVEAKAYSEALLDIAQQANVTLIGAAACSGVSRSALAGDLSHHIDERSIT